MKLKFIIATSIALIALGIINYPSPANDTAAIMLGKLKRAYPSLEADQLSNAQKILQYGVQTGITDEGQLAYVLSTAIGESGLRPVKERRCRPGTTCYKEQEKYWVSLHFKAVLRF
jgi:hypothetical protein